MKTLPGKISFAIESCVDLEDLNCFWSLPQEYQKLTSDKRKPIQEHFGKAIFPIPSNFDTGFDDITFIRLAKALIEPDPIKHDLRRFYTFMPVDHGQPSSKPYDPELVQNTLIRFMLYDYACLHNFKMPYKRLMVEVGKQTPGAFFKMVQVDKTFMTGPIGSNLIIQKQHQADWKFFKKLGEAIQKKPVDEPVYMFKAKLIAAYLWDDHFSKMPYPEMVRILKKEKILPKNVLQHNFKRMLQRVGIKKNRYNRKN